MPIKDSTIRLKLVGSTDVTTGIQALSKGVSAELENLRRATKAEAEAMAGGDAKIIAAAMDKRVAAEKQFDSVVRASEDARTKSKSQNQVIAIKDEMNLRMAYLDKLAKKEPALADWVARAKIETEAAAQHQISQIVRKEDQAASEYRNKLYDEEFKAKHTKREYDLHMLRRWRREEQRIHAGDAEMKQRINETYAAKRDQLLAREVPLDRREPVEFVSGTRRQGLRDQGSLSGFGGKMILGGAVGMATHAATGSGEVGSLIGTTLSSAMFGGPLIAAAVAGAQLAGMAIEEARRHRIAMVEISAQSGAEFRQSVQWASQFTDRPITAMGAGLRSRAYSIKEHLASRQDEYKVEDEKRTAWDRIWNEENFRKERDAKLKADVKKQDELWPLTKASNAAEQEERKRREYDSTLLERDAKTKGILFKQDRESAELENRQADQLKEKQRVHEDYVASLNTLLETKKLEQNEFDERSKEEERLYSIEKGRLENSHEIEKATLGRQHAIEREELGLRNQLKESEALIAADKQGFAAEREMLNERHRTAMEIAQLNKNPLMIADALKQRDIDDLNFANKATQSFRQTLAGVDITAATALLDRQKADWEVQARAANPAFTDAQIAAEVQKATTAEYTLGIWKAQLETKRAMRDISKEEYLYQQMLLANPAASGDPAMNAAMKKQAAAMAQAEAEATKTGLQVEQEKIKYQYDYIKGQMTRLDMEKAIALAGVPPKDRARIQKEMDATVELDHKKMLAEKFMSPVDRWRKDRDDILEAQKNGDITSERARHLLQVGVNSLINQPTGQFSTMATRWQDLQSAVLKPEDDTQRLLLEELKGVREDWQELRRIGFPIRG